MEENRDSKDFSFNAIKYIVILSMQLGQYEKMLKSQKQLLAMSVKVSKNDLTEAINLIQDQIQSKLGDKPDEAMQMYELILGNLKQSNERLWFATCLRLGKIYLDGKSFT